MWGQLTTYRACDILRESPLYRRVRLLQFGKKVDGGGRVNDPFAKGRMAHLSARCAPRLISSGRNTKTTFDGFARMRGTLIRAYGFRRVKAQLF